MGSSGWFFLVALAILWAMSASAVSKLERRILDLEGRIEDLEARALESQSEPQDDGEFYLDEEDEDS